MTTPCSPHGGVRWRSSSQPERFWFRERSVAVESYASPLAQVRAMLAAAPELHLASMTPEGRPVLPSLNAALVDDFPLFLGAKTTEKTQSPGRPPSLVR